MVTIQHPSSAPTGHNLGGSIEPPSFSVASAEVKASIVFTVGNTWTRLEGADSFALEIIDKVTQYPTQLASAKEAGIEMYDVNGNPIEWDGYVRLLRVRKTMPTIFPSGLLDTVRAACQRHGYSTQTVDERVRPEPGFPETKPKWFKPRQYQKDAIESALKAGYGIIDSPPRSGKTLLMMEIHRSIALPSVWVVPTDRIAKQTIATAEKFFGKHYAVHQVGRGAQEKLLSKNLVICTAATANGLEDTFWKSREMLIVDEFHHVPAKTWREIMMKKCEHIYHRYGMTGTHFRSGDDGLAMHALLSNVVYQITSTQLVDLGYLVPTDIMFLPVTSKRVQVPGSNQTFIGGHGKYGIHEHEHRNDLVAYAAALLAQAGKKVLVLVGTKAQGWKVLNKVRALLPGKASGAEFDKAEFVSTDLGRGKIDRILDSYVLVPDEVQVLIGTSLVGEGVDLPSADALVYARGEKAEVGLMQSSYRVCTAVEGKDRAILVDFADRHSKKLLRHSLERLECYASDPLFKVKVLNGVQEFVKYLSL